VSVFEELAKMPVSRESYYRLRALEPSRLGTAKRAARFIYLNRNCFNGVYRTNRLGQFNVPFGSRLGASPDQKTLASFAKVLEKVDLRAGDFEQTLEAASADDFVYLDPPYSSVERKCYGEYGYDSFNCSDIPRLLDCVRRLDRVGARVLLSFNSAIDLRIHLPGWSSTRIRVRRHVAGFAKGRREVEEVLISNLRLLPERSDQ